MNTQWIKNSRAFDSSHLSSEFWMMIYILIVSSASIIIHSFVINARKWNTVRACAEISSFASFFGGFMIISASSKPTSLKTAICYDFLWNGLCLLFVQLCDAFIFLDRLKAITKLSRAKQVAIHTYVWLVLVLTWIPTFTIVPFFFDTNSPAFLKVYYPAMLFGAWGIIAFNFYFTFEFVRLIDTHVFSMNRTSSEINFTSSSARWAQLIVWKSIVHCVTSSLANLLAIYLPTCGVSIYELLIILSLHFLFNFKVENHLFKPPSAKTRVHGTAAPKRSQLVLSIPLSKLRKSLVKSNKVVVADAQISRNGQMYVDAQEEK